MLGGGRERRRQAQGRTVRVPCLVTISRSGVSITAGLVPVTARQVNSRLSAAHSRTADAREAVLDEWERRLAVRADELGMA